MTNVLIVGATSAIAHEVAKHFARAGDRLFLVGRNEAKLQAVADDLRVRGAERVETFLLDVNEVDRHEAMLDAAEEALGPLDVALIAHGVLPDQQAAQRDVRLALDTFHTNATSVIALLTPLANRFEKRGKGTIAVISSVAGDRGRQSNYVYGSAKAAVTAFTSGLRNRLYRSGVHVLTVKPGMVDTPMTAHMRKGPLFASPQRVGQDIYNAILKGKDVLYTPWYWALIMWAIIHLPESIFKRLRL
ncbi:MAG: SDR family oxidoreductase [Chloroflexi bacterium]|nr:SDR family oxidoreductase [Chloroflexota bacterium]